MPRTARLSALFGVLALATLILPEPAQAHPHVWVVTREVLEFDAQGQFRAVLHDWTFDEAYSSYAVQGFDTGPDGRPTPEKLAELAKVNVESLAEFEYFTVAKANGGRVAFAEPTHPSLTFENGQLTLHFRLPAKAPATIGRSLAVEVFDPTFFVDFALAEGTDAARLVAPPAGCELRVNRPKPPDPTHTQTMSESFFSALGSAGTYGAQFSNRILVAC